MDTPPSSNLPCWTSLLTLIPDPVININVNISCLNTTLASCPYQLQILQSFIIEFITWVYVSLFLQAFPRTSSSLNAHSLSLFHILPPQFQMRHFIEKLCSNWRKKWSFLCNGFSQASVVSRLNKNHFCLVLHYTSRLIALVVGAIKVKSQYEGLEKY